MPIENPHGWRKRSAASAAREEEWKKREAVRLERNRMIAEADKRQAAGLEPYVKAALAAETPATPAPPPAPTPVDPNELSMKALRDGLAEHGVHVPVTTGKARLVELWNEKIPKPPPPPPPPNTVPAIPKEE